MTRSLPKLIFVLSALFSLITLAPSALAQQPAEPAVDSCKTTVTDYVSVEWECGDLAVKMESKNLTFAPTGLDEKAWHARVTNTHADPVTLRMAVKTVAARDLQDGRATQADQRERPRVDARSENGDFFRNLTISPVGQQTRFQDSGQVQLEGGESTHINLYADLPYVGAWNNETQNLRFDVVFLMSMQADLPADGRTETGYAGDAPTEAAEAPTQAPARSLPVTGTALTPGLIAGAGVLGLLGLVLVAIRRRRG